MSRQPNRPESIDPTNSPIAWFAVLERARYVQNFERAADALRELKRLGVIVRYRKPGGARAEGQQV